jgi:hypothetical protein
VEEPQAKNEVHQEGELQERQQRAERQRYLKFERYRYRTLWMIMLGCSGIFLSGIWLTGVDMETLFERQEKFKPAESDCIQTGWIRAAQEEQLVKVCNAWVNLSDPTGRIHRLQGAELVKQPNGSYEIQYEERINYRLLAMIGFVCSIGFIGHWLHNYLIKRYRAKLGEAQT